MQVAYLVLIEYYKKLFGEKRNFDKEKELFDIATKNNNDHARLLLLAICYLNGWGTEKKSAEAKELLNQVISNSECKLFLAEMRLFGWGIKRSLKIAFTLYYQVATECNDKNAQFNVASCYQYGLGVKKDLRLAQKWHKKAMLQEHPGAYEVLKKMMDIT